MDRAALERRLDAWLESPEGRKLLADIPRLCREASDFINREARIDPLSMITPIDI